MNIVTLVGRLTADPEQRYTQDQTAVTSFTVAVDRFTKDKGADFIRCTAFGKTAENVAKYTSKGSQVAVTGSWRTGSYEKDGRKVYTNECSVSQCQFIGSKETGKIPETFVPVPDNIDDELPFG